MISHAERSEALARRVLGWTRSREVRAVVGVVIAILIAFLPSAANWWLAVLGVAVVAVRFSRKRLRRRPRDAFGNPLEPSLQWSAPWSSVTERTQALLASRRGAGIIPVEAVNAKSVVDLVQRSRAHL